jgi:hypothetical protein
MPAIGVTTANGVLRLLQTTMEEPGLLLGTAAEMLVSALRRETTVKR